MNTKKIMLNLCVLIVFSNACSTSRPLPEVTSAYSPADKALYDTIALQDSLLFAAFNDRNLEQLKTFFASSLEVFQDNAGLRNYAQTVEAFEELFQKDYVLTRELVRGSLEVYPIKNYGAIETGRHTFCHTENGKPDCGTFKFVHIWEQQNGQWKITKIITYDHKM